MSRTRIGLDLRHVTRGLIKVALHEESRLFRKSVIRQWTRSDKSDGQWTAIKGGYEYRKR